MNLENKNKYAVLLKLHMSEKSVSLSEKGIYVFITTKDATSALISNAVQDLFGVVVEKVNVANYMKKSVVFRQRKGFRAGYKKAYVKLAKGFEISLIEHDSKA